MFEHHRRPTQHAMHRVRLRPGRRLAVAVASHHDSALSDHHHVPIGTVRTGAGGQLNALDDGAHRDVLRIGP